MSTTRLTLQSSPKQRLPHTDAKQPYTQSLRMAGLGGLARQTGNRAMGRLLGIGLTVQAKLMVGPVADRYELEADRIARAVARGGLPSQDDSPDEDELQLMQQPSIQRLARPDDEESHAKRIHRLDAHGVAQAQARLQRRSDGSGEAPSEVEEGIRQSRGRGHGLDRTIQASMGNALGADFSAVRIHTDSRADRLNQGVQARAFTTGQDIFFRRGAYAPDSDDGRELLAHELTHVVQQTGSRR